MSVYWCTAAQPTAECYTDSTRRLFPLTVLQMHSERSGNGIIVVNQILTFSYVLMQWPGTCNKAKFSTEKKKGLTSHIRASHNSVVHCQPKFHII